MRLISITPKKEFRPFDIRIETVEEAKALWLELESDVAEAETSGQKLAEMIRIELGSQKLL
jgi:hypothetical protein